MHKSEQAAGGGDSARPREEQRNRELVAARALRRSGVSEVDEVLRVVAERIGARVARAEESAPPAPTRRRVDPCVLEAVARALVGTTARA